MIKKYYILFCVLLGTVFSCSKKIPLIKERTVSYFRISYSGDTALHYQKVNKYNLTGESVFWQSTLFNAHTKKGRRARTFSYEKQNEYIKEYKIEGVDTIKRFEKYLRPDGSIYKVITNDWKKGKYKFPDTYLPSLTRTEKGRDDIRRKGTYDLGFGVSYVELHVNEQQDVDTAYYFNNSKGLDFTVKERRVFKASHDFTTERWLSHKDGKKGVFCYDSIDNKNFLRKRVLYNRNGEETAVMQRVEDHIEVVKYDENVYPTMKKRYDHWDDFVYQKVTDTVSRYRPYIIIKECDPYYFPTKETHLNMNGDTTELKVYRLSMDQDSLYYLNVDFFYDERGRLTDRTPSILDYKGFKDFKKYYPPIWKLRERVKLPLNIDWILYGVPYYKFGDKVKLRDSSFIEYDFDKDSNIIDLYSKGNSFDGDTGKILFLSYKTLEDTVLTNSRYNRKYSYNAKHQKIREERRKGGNQAFTQYEYNIDGSLRQKYVVSNHDTTYFIKTIRTKRNDSIIDFVTDKNKRADVTYVYDLNTDSLLSKFIDEGEKGVQLKRKETYKRDSDGNVTLKEITSSVNGKKPIIVSKLFYDYNDGKKTKVTYYILNGQPTAIPSMSEYFYNDEGLLEKILSKYNNKTNQVVKYEYKYFD